MKSGYVGLSPARLLVRLAAGAAFAALLAGCATSSGPAYSGSIGNSSVIIPSDLTPDEALGAVQKWGDAYTRDGKDRVAALNYAAALRAAGQTGQAVAVMRKAVIYHTDDREVLAAYGKALAANGQFQEALDAIQRAQRSDNPDWQLLAAEGGILDSMNRHEEARTLYQQALVLAPNEPQVLNNLGLSYVLTSELDKAEATLRQAAANPRATLKIKENLALVLRLEGKHAEADQIAPPSAAGSAPAAGAPAVQGAIAPDNTWSALAKS